MKFIIVNDVDRPDERHVAQVLDGKAYYIHPDLKHWHALDIHNGTDLKAFGFSFQYNSNDITFVKTKKETATYANGKLRLWQGSPTFSYKL